jgi:hypothetical protein
VPENTDLTMHVPVSGEVLLRVNGVEGVHTMGAFETQVPVTLAVSAGRIGFDWTPKVWEEAINTRGVGTPTPLRQNPNLSTYSIILKVLEDGGVKLPEPLAEKLCETLGNEGRLSA